MEMETHLQPFEDYVTSLSHLGVFPSFSRYYNGWTCILRNSVNRQIMPFDLKEQCWAETMLGALTIAVDRLNKHFPEPKQLHKYIATGIDQNVESLLQSVEDFHSIRS
jgi:hypothetical protein